MTGARLINSDSIFGTHLSLVCTDATGQTVTLNDAASGLILTSTGTTTLPTWQTPAAATNLAGGTAGAIPYQTAPSTTTFLSIPGGTLPYHLTTTGGSTAPVWTNTIPNKTIVLDVFASSPYIPSATCVFFKVILCGGGGGSGSLVGPNPSITGGGGAGGAAMAYYLNTVGSFPFLVGIGGAGGTAGGNGGTGADTLFAAGATLLQGHGGTGGAGLAASTSGYLSNGGVGGTVTFGGSVVNPVVVVGQYGSWGGQYGSSGKGGDTGLGLGTGGTAVSYGAGATWGGFGFGAGAGGTVGSMASTTYPGTNGQSGVIIIEEYNA